MALDVVSTVVKLEISDALPHASQSWTAMPGLFPAHFWLCLGAQGRPRTPKDCHMVPLWQHRPLERVKHDQTSTDQVLCSLEKDELRKQTKNDEASDKLWV